jgi:YcxB-like protein
MMMIFTRRKDLWICAMEVTYRLTPADYVEAQRIHLRSTWGYKVLIFIAALFALYATYEVVFVDILRAVPPALASALWIFYPFLFSFRARRDFAKHPNLGREYVLRVEDNGLHMSSDVSQGGGKWSAYTKFRETPNLFVLYAGARLFFALPKRFFSSEQQTDFRELLIRNVAQ